MLKLRDTLFRLDAVVIGLLLALLSAAVAAQIVSDYRSAMALAVAAAETDAQLITGHTNVVFRTIDASIRETLAAIGERPVAELADAPDLRPILAEFTRDLIEGGAISILDERGELVVSSSPSAQPGISFADREYFQAVAAGAPRFVSTVKSGRIIGEPLIVVSQAIRSGGSFRGAVIIAMQSRYFSDFYESIQLGPHSSVSLVRDDGTLLARAPPVAGEAWAHIARRMPADVDQMVNIGPSSIDRANRIAAMRRVPGQPLIVSAALATDTVLAPWRRRSIAFGGFAAGAIALLAALAFLALRASARERAALEESRKLSADLTVALERERMLRSELLHRTKNNLAMMIAMLKVEGRRPDAEREAFAATANRITALALAQQSLDDADVKGDIECAEYLGKIAAVLAKSEPHAQVKMVLALEAVTLRAERAQALGLIANELITNSIKHAFHGRPGGTVTMKLRACGNEVLFDYQDDGPGFRGAPRADSKGVHLIAALCGTLGAHYTITGDAGMRFHLAFRRPGEPLVGGGAEPAPRRTVTA